MFNFRFNSILQLVETFKTELDCYKYLENIRWKDEIVCPVCGNTHKIWRLKNSYMLKCSKCLNRFTVKTGTIFEESRLSLRKWFMAIYLLTSHSKGISSVQLAKDLNITQKSAWFLAHRIRFATENFRSTNEKKFNSTVEIDETYVGGKNKNKHKNKRIEGTQGRNTKDKVAVLGILQRKTEISETQVVAYKIDSASGKYLKQETIKHIELGINVMTDDWKGYRGFKFDYKHEYIKHSKGKYVEGEVHTNTIEGFWSLFKRMFVGIYHYMSDKHINQYLNTLSFRYNNKGLKSNELFDLFLSKCYGRLSYRGLIESEIK